MKLKVSTRVARDSGILYVLQVDMEGKTLYKVGVTGRKIEERVSEILTSIWKKYRYFPYCYPKRFKKVDNVYAMESRMHELLKEWRHETEHAFSGSTEMFEVDEDIVVRLYEEVVSGSDGYRDEAGGARGRDGSAGVDGRKGSDADVGEGEEETGEEA